MLLRNKKELSEIAEKLIPVLNQFAETEKLSKEELIMTLRIALRLKHRKLHE